jgi:hypothetical protein
MKVQSTHYKGIEFVSFQELPADQQLLLQHNTELSRIQILIDGKVCRNCIQYKDYSDWYASVFLKSLPIQEQFKRSVKHLEVAIEA